MTQDDSRFDVPGQLAVLRRYARSLTRDEADAEDLVHDALVRAYERRGTFRYSQNLRTWLLSILHNSFVDRLRRRATDVRRLASMNDLAQSHHEAPQDHAVRLAEVRKTFMELPDEQRAALHLVGLEGLTYDEAATMLGVPVGTVMSRVNRARAALRAIEDVPEKGGFRSRLKIVGGLDGSH